jgi:hypothetical protein
MHRPRRTSCTSLLCTNDLAFAPLVPPLRAPAPKGARVAYPGQLPLPDAVLFDKAAHSVKTA